MSPEIKEAFICDAIRTPFGRYGGALAGVRTDDLAALPIKELLIRNPSLDPTRIDDVILGCANQAGEDNRNVARMASLLAGLPDTVSASTVNRLCGSGMDAVAMAARSIRSGEATIIIAGGVESMSRAPFVMGKAEASFSRSMKLEDTTLGWRLVNPTMKSLYGTDSMPETAENVAEEYGVVRGDQDAFALRSQQRAAAAAMVGILAEEIAPVTIPQKRGELIMVRADEQPRPDSTLEGLSKLGSIVKATGTVTAGNASGINDGAVALLLASPDAAKHYGLRPLGRVVATATAGVPPRIMGIGPVPATKRVLSLTGLRLEQMDVIELNEAFAAQTLAVLRQLGIADDAAHVNPNGGAIALGHPLGASGARLIVSALRQLHRSGGHYGLCTMCIGVGQGIAMIVERV
jgi:3-oxoadipyl-CoA thiolase